MAHAGSTSIWAGDADGGPTAEEADHQERTPEGDHAAFHYIACTTQRAHIDCMTSKHLIEYTA